MAADRSSRNRFPWYKERLKWKYIQKIKDSSLCSSKWDFLPVNMDDFRSGIPVKHDYSTQKKKRVAPPVVEDSTLKSTAQSPLQENRTRLHMSTVYSRVGPRIQKQKDRLDEAQLSLLEHPMGLYAHLEESLPFNIAEDIVDILDPYLKPSQSDSVFTSDSGSIIDGDTRSREERLSPNEDEHVDVRTMYQFPLKKSRKEELENIKKAAELNAISPEQEAVVNNVMQELVDWTKYLGENNDKEYINEATIKKLFASDYESKPVLTAPIHVTELSNVPHELRVDSRGQTPSATFKPSSAVFLNSHIPDKDDHLPKSVKGKYGAWYLDTRLWKLRAWNEPLQDPKEVDRMKDTDRRMRNLILDDALLDTHGAAAFKDFINSRPGVIMPKFLKAVGHAMTPPANDRKRTNNQ